MLTAWAAGKFVPERIAKFVNDCGIAETISHREIIIPGAVAQISGELAEELDGWNVIVGPYEAADIPAFLKQTSRLAPPVTEGTAPDGSDEDPRHRRTRGGQPASSLPAGRSAPCTSTCPAT